MPTLVARLAPQRSTQYTDLVRDLAPHELRLSVVGDQISGDLTPLRLANSDYLRFTLPDDVDTALLHSLDSLATTDAYFHYYERIGEVDGPLLKPVEVTQNHALPPTLVEARRYRGKTNELFTQFMVNIARYSSDYRDTPWDKLTLVDPLVGGGTTLFVGMVLGADVGGVEADKKAAEGTVAFLKGFTREGRIRATFREDKVRGGGKRTFLTVADGVRCIVAHADTTEVARFVDGLKRPQLIVTDLPYNIQHSADWQAMLVEALPAWADLLADGGALVFSWNATRFGREAMIDLVEDSSAFTVLNDPPYDALAHQVDRVIKRRDVIVARPFS